MLERGKLPTKISLTSEHQGVRMIATLSGKLKLREPGRLIVETAGVGYEIFVP